MAKPLFLLVNVVIDWILIFEAWIGFLCNNATA